MLLFTQHHSQVRFMYVHVVNWTAHCDKQDTCTSCSFIFVTDFYWAQQITVTKLCMCTWFPTCTVRRLYSVVSSLQLSWTLGSSSYQSNSKDQWSCSFTAATAPPGLEGKANESNLKQQFYASGTFMFLLRILLLIYRVLLITCEKSCELDFRELEYQYCCVK